MLHYVIQTIAFQLLFLLIFDVFLKKETFFNYNRAYLLVSTVLSLVLPFIKIESFKEALPKTYVFSLPEIFIGEAGGVALGVTQASEVINKTTHTFSWSWDYVIYVGCAIAFLFFLFKLSKILFLAYKYPKRKYKNMSIVELKDNSLAFSFFNYIFLGDKIKSQEKETIMAHEQVHVLHKHSLDLLFFEVLRVLFWFNPLIYFYQKRISNVHEFIADSEAVKHNNKKIYYENLLSQIFDTKTVSFINPFFKQSLIKKRIIMLSKNKSKQINLFKYALLIPMVIGMLVYNSCESRITSSEDMELKEKTSNLSEEELLQKYIQEVKDIEAKVGGHYGADKIHAYSAFKETNDYIQTRDRYIRNKAHRLVRANTSIKQNYQGEAKKEKRRRFQENVIDEIRNKSYQEYLDEKKTPEAIKNWERWSKSFQLNKYVANLDNITAEEQKIIDSHTKLVETDEYYNTLIISDGLRHKKIESKKDNSIEAFDISDAISFAVVENVPYYPECEDLANKEEKKTCFSSIVNKFVAQNFDTTIGKTIGLTGMQKISVFFTITTTGEIANIKVRAPHTFLERETYRVIKALPKPNPGIKDGAAVNVNFFLPIKFNIAE